MNPKAESLSEQTRYPFHRAPRVVWVLGLGGLIPFFALSGLYVFGPVEWSQWAELSLLHYAVAILSFLGGIRWGFEMGHRPIKMPVMVGSVVVCLAAWATVIIPDMPMLWRIITLKAALIGQWYWDIHTRNLPHWYGRLRTILTLGAAISLAIALEQALQL
ncbi:MAG: DUF3429 domain-containing protein [Asticcacaulis sp.]